MGSECFTTVPWLSYSSSFHCICCWQNQMPFSSIWDIVLHPWVHMLLTQETPVQTSQKRVIPVDVCGQGAHLKWRKCGGQMKSVGSSSLRLRMQLANPATSTVASAERMFQFWRTAHLKSETHPRCQAFRPWPAIETGDTWLAGTGLWGKPPDREWVGASKGIHSSRSSCYSQSRVSFCWGSDCGWFWSSGCHVASSCEGVIAGWSVATGWVLRVGSSAVVAIYFKCQPSEHRRDMVSGRGVGWYFLFHVSTYPCPLAYFCCVLVGHFERDVPLHSFLCVWLGEGAWAPQQWVWGARIRFVGAGADMG